MAHPATIERLSDTAGEFLARAPGRHFIGGEWVPPAEGATFESIDPATGDPIAEVAQGGADDVARAVDTAKAAFEDKWTARTAPHKRAN